MGIRQRKRIVVPLPGLQPFDKLRINYKPGLNPFGKLSINCA